MTPATLAATLLIVATLADIASTEYALRRGLSEGNPVAAKLMSRVRQVLGPCPSWPWQRGSSSNDPTSGRG
jgi:hypothetical protein